VDALVDLDGERAIRVGARWDKADESIIRRHMDAELCTPVADRSAKLIERAALDTPDPSRLRALRGRAVHEHRIAGGLRVREGIGRTASEREKERGEL
jgi:hypothetical protein